MSRTIERRDRIPLALPGQISRAAENDTQHLWAYLPHSNQCWISDGVPAKIKFSPSLYNNNLGARCSRCWTPCRQYNFWFVKPGHNFSISEFRLDWRNANSGDFFWQLFECWKLTPALGLSPCLCITILPQTVPSLFIVLSLRWWNWPFAQVEKKKKIICCNGAAFWLFWMQ